MTKDELGQLIYLRKEAIELEKEISELRNSPCEKSGELISVLQQRLDRCVSDRLRIERFISLIDDSFIRQVFHARYVLGLSWCNVALFIGGGNSAEGVRKAASRYLESQRKK